MPPSWNLPSQALMLHFLQPRMPSHLLSSIVKSTGEEDMPSPRVTCSMQRTDSRPHDVQAYYRVYKEHIPVAQLCREVAAVMQEFTRKRYLHPSSSHFATMHQCCDACFALPVHHDSLPVMYSQPA